MVNAAQILAAGLAHLCTPGPQTGWPYAVQDELDARDQAAAAEQAAAYGTRRWLDAHVARVGAEARLARLLDVTPPPVEPLPCDPWIDDLYAALLAA